jgi:hypothetical protein
MSRLPLVAVVLALGLARTALAHSPTPASMLDALNAAEARTALGVQRAENGMRRTRASSSCGWTLAGSRSTVPNACSRRASGDDWRRAVAQGVVAVLDARTDLPVIGYGPGGTVFLRAAEAVAHRTD